MSQSDIGTSPATRFTGRVKWFNNKSGYGFITASAGDIKGTDVFVHHSSIMVADQQYKYLVQGEYVEFALNELNTGKHKYQAVDISGISKGQLMCETRREVRSLRSKTSDDAKLPADKKRVAKARGPGPREDVDVVDASAQEEVAAESSDEAEESTEA